MGNTPAKPLCCDLYSRGGHAQDSQVLKKPMDAWEVRTQPLAIWLRWAGDLTAPVHGYERALIRALRFGLRVARLAEY